MKNFVAISGLVCAGLFLAARPVFATNNVISSNTTTSTTLTLNSGDTLTVDSPYTLDNTGSGIVGVTMSGSSTVTNLGTIEQTNGGRAIRANSSGSTFTITNGSTTNSSALITATGNDAFQMNHTGSVTINNYGTISTTHADEGANSTGTGDQGLNMNILSGSGTTTAYTNIVNNYAGATISAYEADAVRPGNGGTINNSGTIISTNASDNTSSSDGIDAQDNNTGVTIINGAGLAVSGQTAANLIEGARHGITGGTQTDTADTAGSSGGNSNGIFDQPFTMSITNNANSTIKGDNGSGINLDGVDGTEKVTISNAGLIQGTGTSRDGDGVDVDGIVSLTNTGTIVSYNAYQDGSEGVTVGGGTIINSGTIEGESSLNGGVSQNGNSAYARGITLAGIDHTETSGVETTIPIEKTYNNTFGADGSANSNTTGTSYITNNSGGLIKGFSDSGIAILGVNTNTGTALYGNYTAANYAVVITNNANATIEGAGSVAVIDGSADVTEPNGTGGTVAVGTASANNETVINYGTITADGTGAAISLGSGTNSVQILGGSASINGDISGGTSAGSNTLTIDPSAGQSFSYSHVLSNFNSVTLKSGTITLSGASTYSGNTSVTGGTTYLNNTTGSGSGTGAVSVSGGATLGGSGIIKAGSGNGVSLAANSTLISGGIQSGTTAGHGLTLDNTVSKSTAMDASLGNVNLTFYLGANGSSSSLTVLDDGGSDAAGELKFAANDTITLTDLTNGQLNVNEAYLLIQAGSNADYSGITTTGDVNGQTNQNGYVTTPLVLAGTAVNSGSLLYLNNGDLEVVPEPSAWVLVLAGAMGLLTFSRFRVRRP
jgi:hypothetical protein